MKKLAFIALITLLYLPGLSLAQTEVFRSFSASGKETKVELRWAIIIGSECSDLEVQRSSDGETFETIHLYAGVCGSNSEDKEYFFTDLEPLPLVDNHYRLRHSSGDVSNTIALSYQFLPPGQNFSIFPHPIRESGRLVFPNYSRAYRFLDLYDQQGNQLRSEEIKQGNEIVMEKGELRGGIYYFRLYGDQVQPLTGKVIFW